MEFRCGRGFFGFIGVRFFLGGKFNSVGFWELSLWFVLVVYRVLGGSLFLLF